MDLNFRLLAESLPHMVWSTGADGVADYCNARLLDYCGRRLEEVPGWLWAEGVHPDDYRRTLDAWTEAFSHGTEFCSEYRLRREADGRYLWHEGRAKPLYDPQGKIIRWFGTCTDIEARKQAAAKLEHYGKLFHYISDVVIVVGDDGLVKESNPALARILGYTEEELRSKPLSEFIHPEDRQATFIEMARQMHGNGVSLNFVNRYVGKNGSWRWLSWNAYYAREDRLFFGSARDVTEKKQAEEALAQARSALEQERDVLGSVMDSTGKSLLAYLDREFNFVRVNAAYANACGYLPAAMIGKNHFAFYPHPENEAIFTRVRDTGVAMEFHDKPFEYPDQPERGITYWDWTLTPVKGTVGEVVGLVLSLVETTERKRTEEKLSHAMAVAEAANRAKSEFLANMSHEIRTPMTVFIAAIEHLLHTEDNPEHRPLLEMANQSAERLRVLIDDVLDISRIEARKIEIETKKFALQSCVREAVAMFAMQAAKKNLGLRLEMAPDTPEWGVGDADRLAQVLMNLISNAIKFTPEGEVRVCVAAAGDFVQFAVVDTGIGIPEDKRCLLFQNFSQVDSSITRKFGGSGLGLAISKGLVELMGGNIGVESTEGKGSIFTFALPLKAMPTE